MKRRPEIVWWFPGGFRVAYCGTPKTRIEWIRLTWRGYIACWMLMYHAVRIIARTALRNGARSDANG